ncbi:hypothetical protein LRS74_04075 [Streptomyces sp. LX-29]|uniref:hypothetical protein n=1 Tax=Streptomyces sp. LX-29 TaxID=2900152 RepID=UPI00240D04F8|nr:hypothetical protein [Streptomyces sp. LX-29]WFB06314.1 hypothetical protein LRS74_04075 [Streptomyces sp. LX-29]
MTETTHRDYSELLCDIDEFAGRLDPRERLAALYGLIAPLLDRAEREDEEISDEPALSSAGVVRALRAAAAGEPTDADALYEALIILGLAFSEDQDRERGLVAQSAFAAAGWLRLRTGRDLRAGDLADDEDPVPAYAPSPFTRIVDVLAWTRSGQLYAFWEDAPAHPELCDLPAATRELRAIRREIAG